MKKLLSMALVVAMVMSLFCVVPTSAAVAAKIVGEAVGTTTTIELEEYAADVADPTSIGFLADSAPRSEAKTECSGEAYLAYRSNNVTGYATGADDDFSKYMSLDIALNATKGGTYTFEILVDKNFYGNPQLYVGGEQLTRTLRTTNSDVWASRSRYYNWTATLSKGENTVQLRFGASGDATSAYWALVADKFTVTLTEEIIEEEPREIPVVGTAVGSTTTIELEEYANDVADPTNIGFPEATAPKSTAKTECSNGAYLDYSSNNVAGYAVGTDYSRYMALDIVVNAEKAGTYTLEILVDKNAYGDPQLYAGGEQLTRTLRTTNSDVWASRSRYYNWTATLSKGENTVQLRFNASGSATSAAWTLRADKFTVTLTEEIIEEEPREIPVVGTAVGATTTIELEEYANDVADPTNIGFPEATAPKSTAKTECSNGAYLDYSSNNVAGYAVGTDYSRYMALDIVVNAEKGGIYTLEICVDKNAYGDPQLYAGGEQLTRTLRASTNDVWTSSRTRYYNWTATLSKGENTVQLRFNASGSATSAAWTLRADKFTVTLTEAAREIPVVGTAVGSTTTIELEDYAADVADPFSIGFPEATAPRSATKAECSNGAYLAYSSNNITGYATGADDDFSKYMSLDIVVDAEKAGTYTFEILVDKNNYGNPQLYAGGEMLARTLRTTNSDVWASRSRYYNWTTSLEEGENTVQLRFHASGSVTSAYWALAADKFTVTLTEEAGADEETNYVTLASNTAKVSFSANYTGKVIVALYGANNKFVGWGTADVTSSNAADVTFTYTGTVTAAKAFIWSNLTAVKPLAAHIDLTVN